MKIPDLDADHLARACGGDLGAIDALLRAIEPGVFNLAVRMLGQRDDARDACQEILLKVVTHLASFRGEAAFSTWVWRIARNHLLTAVTRARESPEVSLEAIDAKLAAGLGYAESLAHRLPDERAASPEEQAAAREVALGCTQGMLMALDRDQRLAYLLDVVFGLESEQAAQVLEVTPAAYRKRLSRARAALHGFMGSTCGLVAQDAACRCERQLPALRAHGGSGTALPEARIHLDRLFAMGDAAAVFRAHPQYQAPEAMVGAIRAALRSQGYGHGLPQ